MANYTIEYGILKVLQLLVADPKYALHLLPVIHLWMEHMHQPQLDVGDVLLEISVDAHTRRELTIPGSPSTNAGTTIPIVTCGLLKAIHMINTASGSLICAESCNRL